MVYYSSCMREGVFMIVLPLIVGDVATNILVDFKEENIKKMDNQLNSLKNGIGESDVIVGKVSLKSTIKDEKNLQDPRTITNFIRKNVNYSNTPVNYITVNTKKYNNSDFYDVYNLPLPLGEEANDVLDYIYGSLVNAIRLSTPPLVRKEKMSLNTAGIDKLFNLEFLNRVSIIKNNSNNSLYLRNQLISEGYKKQLEVLDFLNSLNYDIGESGVTLTPAIDEMIEFFSDTNKEKKTLANYKNMALKNYDSYICLSAFNNLVNGINLDWIKIPEEHQKRLIRILNKAA